MPFDYGALAAPEAAQLREDAEVIRGLRKRVIEDLIQIGRRLKGVKARLGHGHFGAWIEAEFALSERSAQRFMAVAEAFGSDPSRVTDLPLKLVYRLAGAPDEVREAVLKAPEKPTAEAVRKALVEVERAPVSTPQSVGVKLLPESEPEPVRIHPRVERAPVSTPQMDDYERGRQAGYAAAAKLVEGELSRHLDEPARDVLTRLAAKMREACGDKPRRRAPASRKAA